MYISIGKKEGYIDIKEVIISFNVKMICRYLYIFGDVNVEIIDDLKEIWFKVKDVEGK